MRATFIFVALLGLVLDSLVVFGQDRQALKNVEKKPAEVQIPKECLLMKENPCETAECKRCSSLVFPWFLEHVKDFNKAIRARDWKVVAGMFAADAEGAIIHGDKAKTPEELKKIVGGAYRQYGGGHFGMLCQSDLKDKPDPARLFFVRVANRAVVGLDDCTVYQLIAEGDSKGKFHSVSFCAIVD